MKLTFVLFACAAFHAQAEEEACEAKMPDQASGSALLQVGKGHGAGKGHGTDVSFLKESTPLKACSWQLVGNQDGSTACEHLQDIEIYVSGAVATLDEAGYTETAKLCCHHEMSLFVRREIHRQGFDVCDLSDLHGFVHWYDCSNDLPKTFAEMQAEIAGASTNNCPWLGHLPNCPVKDENCLAFPACPAEFSGEFTGLPGASADLDEAGYAGVSARCCHTEMEQFVRREIDRQGFQVCNEGSLQGFLHWFDCSHDHADHDEHGHEDGHGGDGEDHEMHDHENHSHHHDHQTMAQLQEGLRIGRSGLPPMCPWLGGKGDTCPPRGHNCPVVEEPEPAAHRRRTACR